MKKLSLSSVRYSMMSFFIMLCLTAFALTASAQNISADIDQGANGGLPCVACEFEWVNGNVNASKAHYIENYSVPYRMKIAGASLTGSHTLVIEWDITKGGKHALDYLTSMDNIDNPTHMNAFGHGPEAILASIFSGSGNFAGLAAGTFKEYNLYANVGNPNPVTYSGSPYSPGAANQPALSITALAALGKTKMRIWGGTITALTYTPATSFTGDNSEQLTITFTAQNSNVVFGWGGHIGSQEDWGTGNSAVAVTGSPYHTRLISIDGTGGNQDRSLAAVAVYDPPECNTTGPNVVCGNTTNVYHAGLPPAGEDYTYQWSVIGDATISGVSTGESVSIIAGATGAYTLNVRICNGVVCTDCPYEVTVNPASNAGADGSTPVCDNSVSVINLFSIITGEQAGGVWSRTSGTGGTFDAAAGTYTPAAGATTSTFQYLVTGASPCPNDASVATVNISAQANAGADGSTPVCDNSVSVINLFSIITGEQAGGAWSRTSGTGGTFDAAAGTYTPAAGATTSAFQYLVTGASPCPNDASVATVNISAQANAGADGSTPVCDNSVSVINLFSIITGEQAGGVWSRTSGTGGTFDAAAGTYTPAAGATTSTFQYLVTGASPCPNDASVATVNISAQANAGADGSTPVCDNSVSVINLFGIITGEQAGGVWSRTSGTGGTFDAAAGTYTPAAGATTSTFQYLVTGASPCPNDASVATVNISAQANAGADGSTPVCDNSVSVINLFSIITGEQAGGAWSRTSGTGGTFNAANGTYTPAPGASTSTFQYLVTGASPCPNDASVATVNISAQANAGGDGSTSVCVSSEASINLFSLITGEQAGGAWTRSSGTGGTFNAAAGTFVPTGATNSTFQYLVTGTSPCPNDASVATVNVTLTSNAGADGSTPVCDNSGSVINLFGIITGEQAGGVWSRTSGTGGTFDAAAGTYTPAAGATTSTFQYLVTGASPCPNDASVATVNISAQANAGADGSTPVCDNSVSVINLFGIITGEQAGGVWSRTSGTGGTFDAAAGTYTPAAGATTSTFQYLVTGASPCPNDASVATVNISAQANAGADGSTPVCDNSVSVINLFSIITGEQAGGAWSRTSGTGGTFNAANGTYTPAAGATTSTFQYLVTGASPCPNDASVATVNISAQANAGADGNTRVCSSSTTSIDLASLITGEQSGGTWSRVTGTGGTFTAATGTFVPTGATTSTFQYLVTGTSPCPNDASVATVNVDAQAIGGMVSTFISECPRDIPELSGTLTLSGHTGSVVRWESGLSPDGPWTNIANTTTTLTYTDLLTTTYFRAVLVNGVCAEVYSAPGSVQFEECQIPTGPYCTFTQGAYGTLGGMMCNGDGTSSETLARIQAAITNGGTSDGMGGYNVTFGRVTAQNRYWTLSSGDVSNVLKMLPGGGGSMMFESKAGGGKYTDASTWFVAPLQASGPNKGKIRNTLFAQTMTMYFNLNTSAGLGSVDIADTLITAAMDCATTTMIPGTNAKFGIPSDVVDYLAGGNGYANTINGLYQLANDVLGGVNTAVSATNVATAVDRLNNAFDGCRYIVSSITNPEDAQRIGNQPIVITESIREEEEAPATKVDVSSFPNPYNDVITFNLKSDVTAKGTLEVYNLMGQKIAVVFEGLVYAGKSQTVRFKVPASNRTNLVYQFRVGTQKVSGKLLRMN